MTKTLAAFAAVVMLFAACGKEGAPGDEVSAVASSTPRATAAADGTDTPGGPTDAPATAAPIATADGAGGATGAGATSAPVATAEPGKSKPPKDGRYVYTYTGKATNPTNPAGGQQSFDGELYNEVSHSGNVYTLESTNSEGAGRTITKTRWTDTRVEMLEISVETPLGTYGCKFNPVLVIVRFPLKAETYPSQPFKGSGNACDGKVDITMEAQETVKDAAGRSYDTWRAKVHTEIRSESFSVVQDETRWASPDLGVEIRSNGKQNGEVKSGAFQTKFSGTSTSVLKQRP